MDLHTTNLLLGIMAAVSVLEALLLIGMGIGGYVVYGRVTTLIADLEARVDHAISGTMGRVDETAERVKGSVRDKVNQAVGVVRGIRAILASLMQGDQQDEPPAAAAGRF